MRWRSGARVAGLLGGLACLAGALVDTTAAPDALVNALHWGGVALVVLALLGIGAGLVSSDLWPLRVVVAVCLVALAAAMLAWLDGQLPDRWVDGVLGLLLAAYCGLGLARPRTPRRRTASAGTHARD